MFLTVFRECIIIQNFIIVIGIMTAVDYLNVTFINIYVVLLSSSVAYAGVTHLFTFLCRFVLSG